MKIYLVSYQDPDFGHLLEWHRSKVEAQKACARLRREYRAKAKKDYKEAIEKYGDCTPWQNLYCDPDPSIFDYDITPTKTGILEFLNMHFTTDNG